MAYRRFPRVQICPLQSIWTSPGTFLCVCVCVVIPRYSGTAPTDMGTPRWITHRREGFTEEEKEINGGRYSERGGRAKSFLNTCAVCIYIDTVKEGQSVSHYHLSQYTADKARVEKDRGKKRVLQFLKICIATGIN